jgi:chemotaxis protein MotB
MAKKKHHEEHENHERWLVSYADFITLLFAFFVVMYSVSRVDNKRLAQVSQAIKFALHFSGTGGLDQMPLFEGPPSEGGCMANVGGGQKKENNNATEMKREAEKMRRRMQRKLDTFLMNRPDMSKSVVVSTEGKKLVIRLSASRFFDPAQAAVRPQMIPVLDVIAAELATTARPVRVEGHTDDAATGSKRFRDNWELSTSRASAVVAYMARGHHIDGKLLTAAGHGSTRPLGDNDTATGREANRRIEMVVEVGEDGLGLIGR